MSNINATLNSDSSLTLWRTGKHRGAITLDPAAADLVWALVDWSVDDALRTQAIEREAGQRDYLTELVRTLPGALDRIRRAADDLQQAADQLGAVTNRGTP